MGNYFKMIAPILLLCFIGTMGSTGCTTIGSPDVKSNVSIKGDNNKSVVFIPTGPNGEKLDNSFNSQNFLRDCFPALTSMLDIPDAPIACQKEVVAVSTREYPVPLPTFCMFFQQ